MPDKVIKKRKGQRKTMEKGVDSIDQKGTGIKNGLTILLILLLLFSSIFLLKAYFSGDFDSAESLRAYISHFGLFAPLILVLIQIIQVILPILPGFLGCIVGAGMFGVFGGFIYNYIGISAGSIIAFFLARRFGSSFVKKMIPKKKYSSYVDWVNTKKSYTVFLFLAILLPLAPDDFLCYFSGLTGMKASKFIWIIIIAKPWCILAYSIIFGYLI